MKNRQDQFNIILYCNYGNSDEEQLPQNTQIEYKYLYSYAATQSCSWYYTLAKLIVFTRITSFMWSQSQILLFQELVVSLLNVDTSLWFCPCGI